jgi:hypothetical protein
MTTIHGFTVALKTACTRIKNEIQNQVETVFNCLYKSCALFCFRGLG